jgi:hypothetical protein
MVIAEVRVTKAAWRSGADEPMVALTIKIREIIDQSHTGDKRYVRRGKKAGPRPGGRVTPIDQRRKRRR